MKVEGLIIDIDHIDNDERSIIRITLKTKEGIKTLYDFSFFPYLYFIPLSDSFDPSIIKNLDIEDEGRKIIIREIEKEEKEILGKKVVAYKVITNKTSDIPIIYRYLREMGSCYEYDIVFWKRYLIDNYISPLKGVEVEFDESTNGIVSIKEKELGNIDLSYIAFDIEVYNKNIETDPKKDPIIMISYSNEKESKVITYKRIERDFIYLVRDEKELIATFQNKVRNDDYDIIVGYNSSIYDLPYLKERSSTLKINFYIGRYEEKTKQKQHGFMKTVKIPGRINFDVYNVARFVSIVGSAEYLLKTHNLTLSEVYASIKGVDKVMVEKKKIWSLWDNPDTLPLLADYSLSDSISLKELFQFFYPLELELAKLVGLTLSEVAVSTTGQLVEYLLMREAHKRNQLIPNKPDNREIEARLMNPIEGAYVKTPEAGIYENIVVFDFRGLYPSIIVSHNIDPSTITTSDDNVFIAPSGYKFKKDPQGIMPYLLNMLIEERAMVKKAYKANPNDKALGAKSQALKILANSFYGYLGYARSRWYSREAASSVTAYGRYYIKMCIEEAEKRGFKVLYGDTDSIFLLLGNKTKEEAIQYLKDINNMLPKGMELELEDFYLRGLFVSKKNDKVDIGAKKKYALLSESGKIKIRGFELVRRDWSNIARETQKKVLETILKEGSKEKAIEVVKDIIQKVKSGNIPLKDMVIYTMLRKNLSEYDAKSPELAAALKAIKKGKKRSEVEGYTIGYIITKEGSSISEKAELEEFAKDYDPNYYIEHQIIPATLKILKELGVTADDLLSSGKQNKLF